MPEVQNIIYEIEKFAPLESQEKWDNSGWQINLGKKYFSKIMTAVTVTYDIIQQAKEQKCDLILSHHPLIFSPLKSITKGEITEAVKSGIQIYSAHTNIDKADGGTTDILSQKCGFGICENKKDFIRYKNLDKEIEINFLKADIKNKLNIDFLKIVNLCNKKTIKSVAFCAGAGGGEIPFIQDLGIDLFITGEVKFHEAIDAKNSVVFAVGHYDSEKYINEIFKKILGNKYEIIGANEKRPYIFS
ncbi:Nif3-like dinuclear metal center hexameric protein [bacterium]|nr:Nif3-like dinuclear metal center hexameric protein [bacterium]